MAILEKKVDVVLAGKNTKRFESLGYEIPRQKTARGMKIPEGSKIRVKVDDLSDYSKVKVTKICDICGRHVENQSYSNILSQRRRNNNLDYCFRCGKIKGAQKKKDHISHENTLYYYAINNNKEYLLEEYSSKNTRNVKAISYGSGEKCLWNCRKCHSEFGMVVTARTNQNQGCPFCAGKKVNSTNSLFQLFPELSLEWDDSKNSPLTPHDVTAKSAKKVWWRCKKCNHNWTALIYCRTEGTGCPACNESEGEKRIRTFLDSNNIAFNSQVGFDNLFGVKGRPLLYDFYLKDYNLLIEYQGRFHDGSGGIHTKIKLQKTKEYDRRKREYAELHNIDLLEIWYWDFDRIEEIISEHIC